MLIIDSHTHLMTLDTERYPLAYPSSSYQPAFEGSAEALHEQMQVARASRSLFQRVFTAGIMATHLINR
jgi:DNA polymerase II large subunit